MEAVSAASYGSLLGAVSLPYRLVIPLRARSPSGTCRGGCVGCGGIAGGLTHLRARRTAASAVITPSCCGSEWCFGVLVLCHTTLHFEERGSQLVTTSAVNCCTYFHRPALQRLKKTVKIPQKLWAIRRRHGAVNWRPSDPPVLRAVEAMGEALVAQH
ncbi:hypothetical protein NDU88_005978 [Pleurodeles waltl]|uniref:Uncharacterized protein n=1 Tax=Pleurodeles waltl TaxID=8319 RepID=A0AAV7UJQ0_PLEWA|nr:hypothetical protein NDU88_005978 [Pleurodeles waltl]